MRGVTGVSETRPEPGGTHKVNVNIFDVSDPAGTIDVRFGGVHRHAREEAYIALDNVLSVLQGEVQQAFGDLIHR